MTGSTHRFSRLDSTLHSPLPTLHSLLSSLYPILRDAYGQLRGYRRRSIRREVARSVNMSSEELISRTDRLRRARYIHALEHFPAYADLVKGHASASNPHDIPFDQLPILTKSDLKKILSTLHPPPSTVHRPLIPHATGGSTGQPFRFYITRESYEWRTAVSDRGYAWAQAEEGQRSFYVWGTAIDKPRWKQRIKEAVHHWLQNRKYFDSFHFDDDRKLECCRQINNFKPVSLVGYAGNLIELARYVSLHPDALQWRAKTAVTAAEGLRPGMREFIQKHLADEVFMSYGSREFMLIGMEGPDHEGYYLSADNLYVEVVNDQGMPCKPGELGRIVVTDLHNDATPFVRYSIGDLGRVDGGQRTEDGGQRTEDGGQLSVDSGELSVGSKERGAGIGASSLSTLHSPPSTLYSLPKLAAVEGRLQEVIVRADGEKLTALFVPHLMKEYDWCHGYQIVQAEPGHITVCLQTEDPDWEAKSEAIRQKLLEKLGDDMQIAFEVVAQLQKTASGKTPIVVGEWRKR